MRTILALSPHADDTELGLGGYLARLRRTCGAYVNIEIAVMARGDRSVSKTSSSSGTRMAEAREAADMLDAKIVFLDAADDGAFNFAPRGKLVSAIEEFLFAGRAGPPDEFYLPLPSFHNDHTVTYEAAIAALRPRMGRPLPQRVYAYEYPANHWGPQVPTSGKVYRRISAADLAVKCDLLKVYASQWVSNPEAPGLGCDAVVNLAELRGSEVAEPFAELFYSIREID